MPIHLPLLVERFIRFGLRRAELQFQLELTTLRASKFMLGVLVLVLSMQAHRLVQPDNLLTGPALHRQLLGRKRLRLRTLRFGAGLRAGLARHILVRQRHQAFQAASHLAIKQGKS